MPCLLTQYGCVGESALPFPLRFVLILTVEGGVGGRDGVVEVGLQERVLGLGVPFAE